MIHTNKYLNSATFKPSYCSLLSSTLHKISRSLLWIANDPLYHTGLIVSTFVLPLSSTALVHTEHQCPELSCFFLLKLLYLVVHILSDVSLVLKFFFGDLIFLAPVTERITSPQSVMEKLFLESLNNFHRGAVKFIWLNLRIVRMFGDTPVWFWRSCLRVRGVVV